MVRSRARTCTTWASSAFGQSAPRARRARHAQCRATPRGSLLASPRRPRGETSLTAVAARGAHSAPRPRQGMGAEVLLARGPSLERCRRACAGFDLLLDLRLSWLLLDSWGSSQSKPLGRGCGWWRGRWARMTVGWGRDLRLRPMVHPSLWLVSVNASQFELSARKPPAVEEAAGPLDWKESHCIK